MSTTGTGGAALTSVGVVQRQHILTTALSLMAQRGVAGTSMRDLAGATGLNVATLYHYFPSKRELLVAVLAERGFLEDLAAPATPAALTHDPATGLGALLADMLESMLEVEDFVRLMMGEVMRGDETAHSVGTELFDAVQQSLEHWLDENEPNLSTVPGAPAVARMLRAMLIGLFFEHVAGVLDDEGDAASAFRRRADEAAAVLHAPARGD
jgi:AcrR family transcriptional regulator